MVLMNDPDRGETRALSPLYAGNIRLDRLNTALRINSGLANDTSQNQMFWSTDARPATSGTKEVIRINLIGPRLINYVSFSIPLFPHDLWLEYLDDEERVWKPCLDARSADALPCRQSTRDSVPSVIPSASVMQGHVHPQHNFSGHWRSLAFKFRPVNTTAIRFILKRTTEGRPPRNVFGNLVDYSLGMKDVSLSFQVSSRDDVPVTNPAANSFAEYESFTTSTDALGSRVDFSIRVNKATHALQGQGGQETDLNLVWRSEPQPLPWAVVNFYVDMRDVQGKPQLTDRFFVDPLYEGANLNLYWSNDEPSGHFDAPEVPLDFPVVNRHDGRGIQGDVLHGGAANKGYLAYVDLDNSALGFTPAAPWWLGLNLNFKFAHGTQNVLHPILDFEAFNLVLTPLGLRLTTEHGDNVHINLPDFDPASPVAVVIVHDGDEIHIRGSIDGTPFSASRPLSVGLPSTTPATLRIGSLLDDTTLLPDFDLNQLVLKVDDIPDLETIAEFLGDPAPFVRSGRTGNALLRYDHTRSAVSGSGFLGGVPDRYEELKWEPVARDFVLRKGFLYFPPTKAKYWKFEFCGLTPEPYEVYKPITRNVLTYPVSMWVGPKESPTLEGHALNSLIPGANSSVNLALNNSYKDSTTAMGTGGNPNGPSATTARVVWDQEARNSIGSAYWAWNFLPLHGAPRTPRFQAQGTHSYEVTVVEHTTKLAYFVGLRAIEAYRLDYLSVEDTPQIIEMFHDTSNIQASNWILTEDHMLSSGDSHYAEVISKPVPSQRIVRAVQFAAQQSAPKQLLPDDDFADPEHRYWTPIGDARLADGVFRDPALGTTLLISRSLTRQSYDSIAESLPTWGDVQGASRNWDEIEIGSVVTLNQGGVSSPPVTTPSGGRIYAAARVSASKDLVSPLHLKIVDDVTDRILVDEEVTVKAGQVVEFYGGFTVNDIVDNRIWRWDDFYNTRLGPYLSDSFTRADANTLSTMDSGQLWSYKDEATSMRIVSNRAKVVTLGQHNWYDTQSPWGVLEITFGTMGTTTADVIRLFDFESGFFDEQGTLYWNGFPNGTANGFGSAILANDVIRVEMMPTHTLPSDRLPVGSYDPVLTPYALVLYRNGTWIKTLVHSRGAKRKRYIRGRAGQEYKSFSWTPKTYGRTLGKTISYLPRTGRGGFVQSAPASEGIENSPTSRIYLDNDGNYWWVDGTWEISGAAEYPTTESRLASVTASTADATMITDVGNWYGSMHVHVDHVARRQDTGEKIGNILCLDYDRGIFVNHAGSIVDRNGLDYGTLFPGGISDDSSISVQFVRTEKLKPENRGGYDPAQYPDQIIARVSSVIVGRYVGPALTVWRGTRRGIAGSVYIGTRGATPAYDLDTAISAFLYAPDVSYIAKNAAAPTWDEVSNGGVLTYDQMTSRASVQTNPRLRAELAQHGESTDSWTVDTLSMYVDPILWYFSTDGGSVWYPALDIRNNPNGVLMFPPSVTVTDIQQMPGKLLMWKAVSYAPQTHISSLVIRPWYAGMLSAVTNNVGLANGGPNAMPYDHYGDIRKDARFQAWNRPIPQDWWHSYRMLRNPGQIPIQPGTDLMYPAETNYPSENLFPGEG